MISNTYILHSGQLRGYPFIEEHNRGIFKTISKVQHYFYFLPPEDTNKLVGENNVLIEDSNLIELAKNIPNCSDISTYSVDMKLSEKNGYKQYDNLLGFKLQWLGVEKCFKLVPKDENGIYIRCRPDLKIHNFNPAWLDLIKPDAIIIPKEHDFTCDKFAVGDYHTMMKYCNFINNITKCGNGNSEEKLKHYLKQCGITVHKKDMGIQLYNKDGTIRI